MNVTSGSRRVSDDCAIHYDVRVPTADPEVTLSADLYRPVGDERVPALLTALPYRKDLTGSALAPALKWMASRGYACLLVDLRGAGSSDGPTRPRMDPGEADDAVAAIGWLAEQRWCTGAVGMWGISYGGAMTMRTASRNPDQLKAIIPVSGPLDPQRYNGARGDLGYLAQWGGSMLLQQLLPPLLGYGSETGTLRWKHRVDNVEPYILDMARHGPRDEVWQERRIDPSLITVPSLCVGGWQDLYAASMAQAYEQIRGPKKLLMGPWMHTMPQDSPFEPIDFLSTALRWWDHWLRGVDTGVMDEPPVTLYVTGKGAGWRVYETWPPAQEEHVETWAGEGQVYNPDPTIGTLSGLGGESAAVGAPLDQHDDDLRSASFTGDPMPGDVVIAGSPRVTIEIQPGSTAPPRRLVVRLTEVDQRGRSRLISGAISCPGRDEGPYRMVLRPATYGVAAGNRLRVSVSDSDFPRLTPLPTPEPFTVSRIEVSVPTMPADTGGRSTPELLDPPTRRTGESWTITRDPVNEGVEVVIGQVAELGTSEGHLVTRNASVAARVTRAEPEGAVSTGDHSAIVRMRTGETFTVTTRVRCTQTVLTVSGEITGGDEVLFARTWETPLSH
ncbi:CocE/NonD family hydrolase [Saccharomonospora sp. NPDC006951]